MSPIRRLQGQRLTFGPWLRAFGAEVGVLVLALCVVALSQIPLAADTIAQATTPPPPSELVQQRTETSRTFDNHDGTFSTSLYSGPVHFRNSQGDWQPISSALVSSGEAGYAYENEANRFRALFKQQLGNNYLAVESGGGRFKVSLQNAAQVDAQTRARGLIYPGVFPGVSLRYDLQPDGVKETLLLANARAPLSYRFVLTPPDGSRMHAAQQDDGSWAFYMAPHARPVFVIDAPFASEDDEPVSRRQHASLDVSRNGAAFNLDLSIDGAWLRDPLRQFPIRVDPTITIQPDFQDASFDFACLTCAGTSNDRLSIGTTGVGPGAKKWRGALQFSLSDLPPGASVASAKLKLYFDSTCITILGPTCGGVSHQIDALKMTGSWSKTSKTSQLAFNSTPLASYTLPSGASSQWMNWDITGTVQSWYAGGPSSNFGLLLKDATEASNSSGPTPPSRSYSAEPTLGPALEVTYNGDGGQLLDPETVHSNGAELNWIPYSGPGAPPFDRYDVHRSTSPTFTPSDSTRLTTIMNSSITSYRDTTAKAGATFTYKVVVNGVATNARTVTMPADGQATKLLRPDAASGQDSYFTYRTDAIECANRGVSDRLKVGTDVNSLYRSLLRFDLGDIPIDATVTAATLSLWHPDTTGSALTVNVHRATSPWQEGTSTDQCTGDGTTWYESDGGVKWAQDGGDFDSSVAASLGIAAGQSAGWHAFDLTSLTQSWAHGDYPNDGLLLKASAETIVPAKFIDYYTSDFAVAPTLRPKLAISYTEGVHAAAPIVSLTSPAASDQVSGGSSTIAATAVDDRRVESVQFFVDGNSIGTDTSEPFSVAWNSATVSNGTHAFTARATDDAGNQTTSTAVSASVGNSASPATSITSPAGGATVTGSVAVAANASDDLGVTRILLLVDGHAVGEDTSAPYAFNWNTLNPTAPAYDGSHSLKTKVFDAQGQATASSVVTVTVANAVGSKFLADLSATSLPSSVRYDPSAQTQEQYGVDVTVTNRSALTWAAGDVVLRYRWFAPDGSVVDGSNLSLGGVLLPNGSTVVHTLVTPPDPGTSRALYRLRFDLFDVPTTTWFADRGNKPIEQPVGDDEPDVGMLGVEPYYQYETLDLGAGMQQLTNVGNANSVIHWVPFDSPGRGLATTVQLTYNSREHCRNEELQGGAGCLAGNGWSFAISSVLRFGSRIEEHPDSADQLAGRPDHRVEVVDADGTRHEYTSSDGNHWSRPDGFHYYLRKVSGNWLLTSPDRTTYAYNNDGFPLYAEDKNQNRITFVPDDVNDPERVVAVQDAGGRQFTLSYYGGDAAAGDDGRLWSVTDHMGHSLEFQYYDDGNLRRLIEHGGSDGDRIFVFTYTRNGSAHGYDPAIANRVDRFDPDPHTSDQSDRIFSVQDPRTIQAHAGNETVFGYENPHGGGQDWQLTTSCDRENSTTSTSPCLRANATTKLTYGSDQQGSYTQVAEPPVGQVNRTTTYRYGSGGLVTAIIDPLNRETDQTWIARHLHEVIDAPTGRKVEYLYNANGLITDQYNQVRDHKSYTYYDRPADGNDTANSISLLHTQIDPGGNTSTSTYDGNYVNLLQVEDPTHATTVYTYYADGTLHTVEDANHHTDHHQTVYTNYDLNGFAQQVTDAKGQLTKAAYNADGLQLSAQDANHTDESYSDQRWFRTVFEYNNFHELVRQTEPKSTHLQAGTLVWNATEYDANGNVTVERGPAYRLATDSSIPVTTTEYDGMDRQKKIIAPDPGRVTTFEYDAAGRLWRTALPLGVATTGKANDYVTENVYDGLDRVVTEISYNAETQDGLPARKTHYCYDGVGDLLWTVAPMAELAQAPTGCGTGGSPPAYTTRYAYDDAHRKLTETDPLNTPGGQIRTRTIEYYTLDGPARGNVRYEFDEDGTRTEYTYTARGEVDTTIKTYLKDGSNNPIRKLTSKTVYDPVGNAVCEVSPRAWDYGSRCQSSDEGYYTTHYTYDDINQLVRTSLPTDANQPCARTYVHGQYDGNGNPTLTTIPDCASDVANVPDNKKTAIDNFDSGWIASTNDHVNPAISYDYEALGLQNLRKTEHRWGSIMRWQYSLGGNLLLTSDRQGVPSKFGYDLNDNQTSASHQYAGRPSDLARFDLQSFYNGFDEQTKVRQLLSTDNWRSTKYDYNDNGELVTRQDDGNEHDNGGQIAPWRVHTFAYDEAGQLTAHYDLGTDGVQTAGDERITIGYASTGWESTRLLERKNGFGGWDAKLFTKHDYFPSGDLMNLATYHGADANAPLLERHTLNYLKDNIYLDGNRVSDAWRLVGPAGQSKCRLGDCTTSYYYGPRENLTQENRDRGTGDVHTTDYHHDSAMNVDYEKLDNVVTRTAQFDGNRLSHVYDVSGPIHDRYFRYQNGNLRCVTTSDVACPAAPLTVTPDATLLEDYRWNGRDRLQSFRRFGQDATSANYGYDPLDRVATQTDSRGQMTYAYLGVSSDVSSETLSVSGSVARWTSYSYGPDDMRVAMTTSAGGDYYYTRNVHTDVSLLIGANASEPTASYVYRPYGGRDSLSNGDPEDSNLTNPYRFNDMRFDPGSSTLDMVARRYTTDVGRFLSEDTFSDSADNLDLAEKAPTQNRYVFAAANPIVLVEADGHAALDPPDCPRFGACHRRAHRRYRLPFSISDRFNHGIDQGVDFETHAAVKAIASGVIYYRSGNTHWRGHGALYEHLVRAGRFPVVIHGRKYYSVYYAEEDPKVAGGPNSGPRNVSVHAGQPLIKMGPELPYTELGFAKGPWGREPAGPDIRDAQGHTKPTIQGHDFFDFLHCIQADLAGRVPRGCRL